MDININRCAKKYWHNDVDTQVGNKNSLHVQNKQDNDIDKRKVNIFPSHRNSKSHIMLKTLQRFHEKCFIWIELLFCL